MADHLSKIERQKLMSSIKGKDTRPEILVRRIIHGAGFRFRLHQSDLPGRPDIVLSRYRLAIFVNGCFWHGHSCQRAKLPKSNKEFWHKKIARNILRDTQNRRRLRQDGWSVYTIWTCSLGEGMRRVMRSLEKLRTQHDYKSRQSATK